MDPENSGSDHEDYVDDDDVPGSDKAYEFEVLQLNHDWKYTKLPDFLKTVRNGKTHFDSVRIGPKNDNGALQLSAGEMNVIFEQCTMRRLQLGYGGPYNGPLKHERIVLHYAGWLQPQNIMGMNCQSLRAPHSHFSLSSLNSFLLQWQGNQELKKLEMIQLGLTLDLNEEVKDPHTLFLGTGAELWHPPCRVLERFLIHDIPLEKSWIIRREEPSPIPGDDDSKTSTMATVVFNNCFQMYVWSNEMLAEYRDRINDEVLESTTVRYLKGTFRF